MLIFHSFRQLPASACSAVLCIGNFDGVHRGHQALLRQGRRIAEDKGMPLAVLTFEPHPRALFRPDDQPFRITPQDVKLERLAASGVDIVFSLPFDWGFASMPAEKFIADILTGGLHPGHIIVGRDFRFGQLRKGNADMIATAGLPVTSPADFCSENGEIVSSSRIRGCLRHGEIDAANAMLGWEWFMRGQVMRGDRRGHELGYPTANIALEETLHPGYGVYAALVAAEDDKGRPGPWMASATNIGIRPMFKIPTGQIESHILDIDQDLYDRILRVRPLRRLRGEARFDSLNALTAQMEEDCRQARLICAQAIGQV